MLFFNKSKNRKPGLMARASSSSGGGESLYESVEELRLKLESMKRMIDIEDDDTEEEEIISQRNRRTHYRGSIINGSFMSFVFIVVLILIICVSVYAFSNLYYAILKKFPPKKHAEL